jgi:capsular polysaccharide biosynthesis protein
MPTTMNGEKQMNAPATDAVGLLRWGLRRYAAVFLACVLLGVVVAPFVAARLAKPADAEALVITQRLDMSLSALPRYGEAVFDDGHVAQAVAAKYGAGGFLKDVIPDRVSLVADQDSIIFHVIGHDKDPKVAAGIANTAAAAFISALNAPGAGVGAFGLQSPAQPPSGNPNGLSGMSRTIAYGLGLAGGVALGLAAVSVILVARRPVMDAAGVEEATGVPALGTVSVPRARRGRFARPDEFPGLVPVCRRLLRLSTSTVVLVSRPREHGQRRQLSVALASVLMRIRDVNFVGEPDLREMADARRTALDDQAGTDRLGPRPPQLTLVDSSEPLDLIQPPQSTATVLVVREGVSSSALRAAVVENLGGSAEARVLLVKRGGRSRGEIPATAGPGGELKVDDGALADHT